MSVFKKPVELAKGALNKGLKQRAQRAADIGGDSAEMTLIEHIIELRAHAVRAAVSVLVTTTLAIVFMDPLLAFLRSPFEAYQASVGRSEQLMSTAVFEVIFMNFKVCLLVGAVAALPYMLLEVWRFVAPALYPSEKKIALPLTLASVVMFYLGVAFGFFVIVPSFLSNTLEWASQYANVMLTVENYYNTLATMVFIFGIIFEVPVIFSLLGLAGILKADMIASNRRGVFFISCLIGAVLSPPDVFSLTITTIPLYGMIELSVFALRAIEKNRAKQEAAAVSGEDSPDGPGSDKQPPSAEE